MFASEALQAAARLPAEIAISRLVFLASAGELLAASLDYAQTPKHLVQFAVPMLGDLSIVDIVEDGSLRRMATTHVEPHKVELIELLRTRYPPSADSPQPAGRVLRSGVRRSA